MRAGDVFVIKQGTPHDLRNTGSGDLSIVAFFPAAQVEQHWIEDVWEPGDQKVMGTPNRS